MQKYLAYGWLVIALLLCVLLSIGLDAHAGTKKNQKDKVVKTETSTVIAVDDADADTCAKSNECALITKAAMRKLLEKAMESENCKEVHSINYK